MFLSKTSLSSLTFSESLRNIKLISQRLISVKIHCNHWSDYHCFSPFLPVSLPAPSLSAWFCRDYFSLFYFWRFPSHYFWSCVNQLFMEKDQWLLQGYSTYSSSVPLCDARTCIQIVMYAWTSGQQRDNYLFIYLNYYIYTWYTLMR